MHNPTLMPLIMVSVTQLRHAAAELPTGAFFPVAFAVLWATIMRPVWFRRHLARRPKGTIYDTGLNGRTTFFCGYIFEVAGAAKDVVTMLCLSAMAIPVIAVGRVWLWQYTSYINGAIMLAWIGAGVAIGQRLGRLLVDRALWLSLEQIGLRLFVRNGEPYPIYREDGFGVYPDTRETWVERMNLHVTMQSARPDNHRARRLHLILSLIAWLPLVVALQSICNWSVSMSPYQAIALAQLNLVLSTLILIRHPFGEWLASSMEANAYYGGCQFIPGAYVFDAPPTLKTIEGPRDPIVARPIHRPARDAQTFQPPPLAQKTPTPPPGAPPKPQWKPH